MGIAKLALLSLGRVGIIAGVAIAFFLGLAGTIYLSLRTSEVKVPDIVGKDRMTGETTLSDAGLNIRVRATRPATDAKPDTILAQLPHAGQVVKVGQTVAVDVSRAAKEGESTVSASTVIEENKKEDKSGDSVRPGDLTEKNANDNKEKRKKPVNKNANNSNANDSNANNANNSNNAKNGNTNNLYGNRETNTRNTNQLNTNARNTNGVQNANTNRATNTNTRNTNAGTNTNRIPTLNTNRRAPNVSTPPFANPNANRRTTP